MKNPMNGDPCGLLCLDGAICVERNHTPDFQKCIVGSTDEDVSRSRIGPATTIDIILMSVDLDRSPVGK